MTAAASYHGRQSDPQAVYTVAANELIATGTRFPALSEASNKHAVGTDLQALAGWFTSRRAADLD